jgi:hypothetical protein
MDETEPSLDVDMIRDVGNEMEEEKMSVVSEGVMIETQK